MIISLVNMYVFFSFVFFFFLGIHFSLRRAGLFAIPISMRIEEKHLRISNEKFRHKGRLRMYPIVPPHLCPLQRTIAITSHVHLPCSKTLILIIPPRLLHTPGDLHPRPIPPLQLQTHSIPNKKSMNSGLV